MENLLVPVVLKSSIMGSHDESNSKPRTQKQAQNKCARDQGLYYTTNIVIKNVERLEICTNLSEARNIYLNFIFYLYS